MKICVPTESDSGLDATVSGHFGRAPYFAFIDSETKNVEFVANSRSAARSGRCGGAALAAEGHPEAVLAAGMGHGAFDLLTAGGARIYLSTGGRLGEAVDAFLAGNAAELTEEQAAGHHHGGETHHHHAGGGCCQGHGEHRVSRGGRREHRDSKAG